MNSICKTFTDIMESVRALENDLYEKCDETIALQRRVRVLESTLRDLISEHVVSHRELGYHVCVEKYKQVLENEK